MADIVEEMMLPLYYIEASEETWSPDALDFLSYCLSGSIESLISIRKTCTLQDYQLIVSTSMNF